MRHLRVYCVICRQVFNGCDCEKCIHDVRYGVCYPCSKAKEGAPELKPLEGETEAEE